MPGVDGWGLGSLMELYACGWNGRAEEKKRLPKEPPGKGWVCVAQSLRSIR